MLFHRTANLKIERLNLGLQRSDRRKKHLQDESVMIRKEALNGSKQLLLFTLQFPTNTGLNSRQCQFPIRNQQLHQIAARNAEEIRYHRINLDIRVFKKPVSALLVIALRINILLASNALTGFLNQRISRLIRWYRISSAL